MKAFSSFHEKRLRNILKHMLFNLVILISSRCNNIRNNKILFVPYIMDVEEDISSWIFQSDINLPLYFPGSVDLNFEEILKQDKLFTLLRNKGKEWCHQKINFHFPRNSRSCTWSFEIFRNQIEAKFIA